MHHARPHGFAGGDRQDDGAEDGGAAEHDDAVHIRVRDICARKDICAHKDIRAAAAVGPRPADGTGASHPAAGAAMQLRNGRDGTQRSPAA